MRGSLYVLIGLFATAAALGQGTFLYTWHGNSLLFQGNFQVTAEENQPGQYFESPLFYSSIRFVSPDDTFTYIWPQDGAGGTIGPPLDLSFNLFNNGAQRELVASAYRGWAAISEWELQNNSQTWVETGYWTSVYVPEPSGGALLGLAAVILGLEIRKGSRG